MENLTLYLTIAQGAVFVAYVSYIVKLFGVPPSISDSWYLLERKGVLFTLFCWMLGACMLYQGNDKTTLFILSGVGISFVGGATMFKWSGAMTDKIHFGSATVGIVCALLGLYIEYHIKAPIYVFTVATILIVVAKVKNSVFWVEMIAFACVVTGLFLRFI
jgi:hypothetical protein